MSEEELETDEAAAEPAVKRKLPLLVLIGAAVILLVVIAAIAALLLFGKKKPAPPPAKNDPASSVMEFGGHIDNADENARRAAALARQAADGDLPASAGNAPGAR